MKALINLFLAGLLALTGTLNAQNEGQLVIFVQDGRSISQDFKRNTLPAIKQIAKQHDLKLKMVDASQGAPLEVPYTPAIFYKVGDQAALFEGRYSDLDDLAVFVKSGGKTQPVSMNKQGPEVLTWNIGRATMATTMRIHPLTGKVPKAKNFDAQQFEEAAAAAALKGMEFFRNQSGTISSACKSYHIAFYPEVHAKEGMLLVQMVLYSALDPDKPVFKTEIPSGGEWKNWTVAFEKAGNRIEKALIAQISNWDNGDGFDTLKETTPVQSWSDAMSFKYEEKPTFIERGVGAALSERE